MMERWAETLLWPKRKEKMKPQFACSPKPLRKINLSGTEGEKGRGFTADRGRR